MRLRHRQNKVYGNDIDELGAYIGPLNFLTVFSFMLFGWKIIEFVIGDSYVLLTLFNHWFELDF